MKKSFIEKLNPSQKAIVLDYSANHSSRETAAFIKTTYGITISNVTVTKMMTRHYAALPTEVKIIKYQSAKNISEIQSYLMTVFGNYKEKAADETLEPFIRQQYQTGAVELALKIGKLATEIIKMPLAPSTVASTSTKEVDSMDWTKNLEEEKDGEVVEGEGSAKEDA